MKKIINILLNGFITFVFIMSLLLMYKFGLSFGTLFVFLVSIGLIIVKVINRLSLRHKHIFWLRHLKNISNFFCFTLIIAFLLVEGLIILDMDKNQSMEVKSDYVIVLGAGLNGDKVSKRLETRLIQAYQYLTQYPDVAVIVSGGQGPDEEISEAKAMGNYLIEKGIQEERIIYENKSTSTFENLKYSKEIIQSTSEVGELDVLIITSDYHMFRAKMIARELGFSVSGLSSDIQLSVRLNYMIREFFAIVKDWGKLNIFKG